jgi:hypothetical protein
MLKPRSESLIALLNWNFFTALLIYDVLASTEEKLLFLHSDRIIRTGRPGFDPRQTLMIFPLTSASRPALRTTQPPVQWVPGALSPGVKRGRGVILTTHPLLVPRIRKSRSYTSCHPNAPLWSVTGPLYLFFTYR